jgi:hypothetical protein
VTRASASASASTYGRLADTAIDVTRFVAISPRAYHTWRMRFALTILALAAAALLPLRANAFDLEANLRAQHVQYPGEPQLATMQNACMSLSDAIESVRRRTDGRIVSAETRVEGGREVHYIKVLTKDGKVRTHKVNGCRR